MSRGLDYRNKFIQYFIPTELLKLNLSTRLATFFLVATTFMLLTSSFTINEAFATHLSEELKWQLVFLSSDSACSNYHIQMTNKYFEVTNLYLDEYQVNHSNYEQLCMSETEYLSDYQMPHDLDLIILVYDKNLGEKELHTSKMGGLYSHSGSERNHNHVVIICDCSNFYYSDPVWIMSHELSHFVLYYRNYDMSVIEDLIHENDAKYDQCQEVYTDQCNSIKTKIESSFTSEIYSVMPIYKPGLKSKTENKIENNDAAESIPLELGKMITKWWTLGKITDGDYANAIGFMVGNVEIEKNDDSDVLFADDPLDDSITWQDKMKELTIDYWDRPAKTEEQTNPVLSKIPDEFKNEDEKKFSGVILGLPEWFKNTAAWWSQGKITDEEFKKNVEYLVKEGIVRPQTSEVIEVLVEAKQPAADDKKPAADDKKPAADDKKPAVNDNMIQDLIDEVKALKDSIH